MHSYTYVYIKNIYLFIYTPNHKCMYAFMYACGYTLAYRHILWKKSTAKATISTYASTYNNTEKYMQYKTTKDKQAYIKALERQ